MLNLVPDVLVTLCAFLFPVFASYKALKTSDPAQLAPWLMYWVVLGLLTAAESWVSWMVVWIPFYSYFRLLTALLMVLPQTQLARYVYVGYVHPWLEENEDDIEQTMANLAERARRTGLTWLRQAVEQVRIGFMQGQGQAAPEESEPEPAVGGGTAQGYVQSLLARFSLPTGAGAWAGPKPGGPGPGSANTPDWLHTALNSFMASTSASSASASASASASGFDLAALMPSHIRSAEARQQFVAAQRERISAWDASLARWQQAEAETPKDERAPSIGLDGGGEDGSSSSSLVTRPSTGRSNPSSGGGGGGGLTQSRSEADFEKLDGADVSGAEEDMTVRRRAGEAVPSSGLAGYLASWMTGSSAGAEKGTSTGAERQ